jgi:lipoate-protein ligase A
MEARFVDRTFEDPYTNLAAEEAIFRLNCLPTLRVWDNQLSVVIGRAQLAKYETNLEYCQAHGVPVVRRFTAGGTVYNGPGNVNWSFFAPASSQHPKITYQNDPRRVFAVFGSIVSQAVEDCSVPCVFVPPNRLDTDGGKVSGMAAYVSRSGVICHGTLLLDADLVEVAELTTPSSSVLDTKYPRSNSVKVANTGLDREEFVRALVRAAELRSASVALTEEEENLVSTLRTKYVRSEWSLGDPFRLDDAQLLR